MTLGIEIENASARGAGPESGGGLRLVRPEAGFILRIAAVLALIVGAYHQSIGALLNGLRLETPLAYLGLVPAVSLFLVVVRAIAPRKERDIYDRYLDYIVGLPLILIALVIVVVVPIHLSTFFWLWRLDLISLPVFAAGAISLAFGVRALWRLRLPLAFLLLAWPPPYALFFTRELESFTSLTINVTRAALQVIPLAQPLDAGDGSLFLVTHNPAQAFVLSVSSACSGVNGMVGFLLVVAACFAVLRGPLAGRLAWLSVGLVAIWALDVVRIMVIFGAGRAWGESFAIDVLHPVVGIVFFNLGLLTMVCAMPLFRLRFNAGPLLEGWRSMFRAGSSSASLLRGRAVPRAHVALALLLGASLVAGGANARLPQFELTAHELGPTRMEASTVVTARVPGWSLTQVDSFSWVRNYLGPDASWYRYDYAPRAVAPSSMAAQARQLAPITLDVMSTSDLSALSAYSLEACYRFHNFQVAESRHVDLGAGVVAKAVAYRNPTTGSDWTAVYWEWPVRSQQRQFYERVVLYMADPGIVQLGVPPPSTGLLANLQVAIANALDYNGDGSQTSKVGTARTRDFMIAFGHQVVMATANQTPTSSAEDVS